MTTGTPENESSVNAEIAEAIASKLDAGMGVPMPQATADEGRCSAHPDGGPQDTPGHEERWVGSGDLVGESSAPTADGDLADLPELAQRIRDGHSAVIASVNRGAGHAIAVGKTFSEAKRRVGHGNWLTWLRNNCPFPERTAQYYMRLASETPTVAAISAIVADLAELEALELLASPETSPKSEANGFAEPAPRLPKVRATGHGRAARVRKSGPKRRSTITAENGRLKVELAIALENSRSLQAELESLRRAAASRVESLANATEAPLLAPAESDLEVPAFLDRRLTERLSEVDRKAFVALAVAWEAFTRARLDASATVRQHFETVVPDSAQARNG